MLPDSSKMATDLRQCQLCKKHFDSIANKKRHIASKHNAKPRRDNMLSVAAPINTSSSSKRPRAMSVSFDRDTYSSFDVAPASSLNDVIMESDLEEPNCDSQLDDILYDDVSFDLDTLEDDLTFGSDSSNSIDSDKVDEKVALFAKLSMWRYRYGVSYVGMDNLLEILSLFPDQISQLPLCFKTVTRKLQEFAPTATIPRGENKLLR